MKGFLILLCLTTVAADMHLNHWRQCQGLPRCDVQADCAGFTDSFCDIRVSTEPTSETTLEPTSETTLEPTSETTLEPTSETTLEPTSETTSDPIPRQAWSCACDLEKYFEGCGKCMAYPTKIPSSECRFVENCKFTVHENDTTPGLVDCVYPSVEPLPEYKTCACTEASVLSAEFEQCFKIVETLGAPCEVPEQCENLQGDPNDPKPLCEALNPAIPEEKSCQCAPDSFTHSGKCWMPILNNDQPCLNDQQCSHNNTLPNLGCLDHKPDDDLTYCGCSGDFVDTNDGINITCQPFIHDEVTPCTHPLQCDKGMGHNATCTTLGRCSCTPPYEFFDTQVADNVRCFIPRGLNQGCSLDGECLLGTGQYSECSNATFPLPRRCACVADALDFEGHCYAKKLVGSPCERNVECTVAIRGEVECNPSTKTCDCKVDYVADMGLTLCRAGGGRVTFSFLLLALSTLKFWV